MPNQTYAVRVTLPPPVRSHAGVPFVEALATHGDRSALLSADETLTYRDLAGRVEAMGRRLGATRRLVVLPGGNDADTVVAYLACLAGGHPVLLVPGGDDPGTDRLVEAYDPDVVFARNGTDLVLQERRVGTRHHLHPDLALLLSTSGSTGSPKLVRLSPTNLQANAASIADVLGIRDTDRAVTTLPLHYCYGLSVLHSHLLRGAALVLTDLSVVDACFWQLFRRHRASTIAGVPYTFELLDRVGFADMDLPHLRYVTQAGGRMAPERVRRYAQLGQRHGWDLFVMYGQTEATARMAVLPPELASAHPYAVGVAVPGGALRLEPLAGEESDAGVGELVYTGANVMLGYAEAPADLALGRTVRELRTGDLARRTSEGLYEVVGRRSRFAKVLGLRIDLARVEAALADLGREVSCVDGGGSLVVAVDGHPGAPGEGERVRLRAAGARASGLPLRAVGLLVLDRLPRLASGKLDHPGLQALAVGSVALASGAVTSRRTVASGQALDAAALCRLFSELLDRRDVTEDSTFVGLGGDSLSYVEVSVRLEALLGHLPTAWHTTPVKDLVPTRRPWRPWRGHAVETNVVLRAAAIVLVVGTHVGLWGLPGGAHVLLAVAGYNFARFHLSSARARTRVRHLGTSIARVVLPSAAWIATVAVLTGGYTLTNVLLLNNVLGSAAPGPERHFWFLEVLVAILLALMLLLAVPAVHRIERRAPFAFAMGLAGLGLLTRYGVVGFGSTPPGGTAHVVFWLFALGWAAALATTTWHRLAVSGMVLTTVPGFYGDGWREATIIAGVLTLVWVSHVRLPGLLRRLVGVLAAGSLFIYLVHWQVYPLLQHDHPVLAVVCSLVAGVAYGTLVAWVTRWLSTRATVPSRAVQGTPAPQRGG